MKNIAVFFGGKSVEHDISIITAMQAMKALPKSKYKVLPIYIKSDGTFVTEKNLNSPQTFLNFNKFAKNVRSVSFEFGKGNVVLSKNGKIKEKIKIDCALLCNHGHGGEDGALQGLLELAEIAYTSSSLASSALCMDKVLTKIMLKSAHIKTPAYVHFNIDEYKAKKVEILSEIKEKIKLPCIIKPASLGSSVGISICEDGAKLESLIEESFVYDDKIIVEQFVENAREFCCAVVKIGDKMFSSTVKEVGKSKIYTFTDKYISAKEEKGKVTKELDGKITKLAKQAYGALLCDGVVRVDFLYDQKDNIMYVNELNSIPGSLAYNLFSLPFADLLTSLIEEGIERYKKKKDLIYSFNSEAIQKYIDMEDHVKYKMS